MQVFLKLSLSDLFSPRSTLIFIDLHELLFVCLPYPLDKDDIYSLLLPSVVIYKAL